MSVYDKITEVARLAINRMVAVTEKEKKLIHKALDSQADAAFAYTETYADAAVAAHVADADPHTQYLENLVEDTSPEFGGELTGTFTYNGQTFPAADGTADYVLKTDGAGNLSWTVQTGGGLSNVVEDTTPQLGGALDTNGNAIVSVSNGDITITPNGTGNVVLGNFSLDADQTVGAGQDNYVLTYDNGTGLISLEATAAAGISNVVEDTTPQLGGSLDVNGNSIVSVSNGDIAITPDGTGDVIIDGLKHPQADGTTGQVLQTNGAGQLSFATVSSGESSAAGFGSISVEGNVTDTTITAASTDFTNKVQITVFDTNGESSSSVTPDHTNDHITVSQAGTYFIYAGVSFSGGSTDQYSMAIFKNNGATQLGDRSTRKLGTGGDVGHASASALVTLSASDTVEIWIQNEDDTDNALIQDCNLHVVGVGDPDLQVIPFSKSITVESPSATEDITVCFTPEAITLSEIRAVLIGSATPSVTWTLKHGTDRSVAGTTIDSNTTTSTTSGDDITAISDATIPADSYIWLETSAQSGTVDEMHITMFGSVD